ncbi:MAG: AhpC/TSA family protein [Bacteroidales bacterium]|nr:AhpC/TSA family protein [Bacteroidales bacterium]
MKKTFLTIFLCAVVMTTMAQKNNYSIVGNNKGSNGVSGRDSVMVIMYNMENYSQRDTTYVLDGKFQFSGQTDTDMLVNIYSNDGFRMMLLLQPGSQMAVNMEPATVTGNRPSEQLNRFAQGFDEIHSAQQKVARMLVSTEDQALKDSLDAVYEDYRQRKKDFVDSIGWTLYEANADNKAGAEILFFIANVAPDGVNLYAGETTPALKRLLALYENASPVVRQYDILSRKMKGVIAQMQMRPGVPFRDFEAIDYATGNTTTLSALIKGHVAVVDFWASWCGPCRKEIDETLKPLHKKYADSGLVVVGVDVLDDVKKHDQAVKEQDIAYPQLVDTDRDNSALLYGVQSIPKVFLFDRSGILIGVFRGEELVREVEKAMR